MFLLKIVGPGSERQNIPSNSEMKILNATKLVSNFQSMYILE